MSLMDTSGHAATRPLDPLNLGSVRSASHWLCQPSGLIYRLQISTTSEIELISKREANCQRLMSVPGVGPIISTAMVAAIGTGAAFDRGRDFSAWLGLHGRYANAYESPLHRNSAAP